MSFVEKVCVLGAGSTKYGKKFLAVPEQGDISVNMGQVSQIPCEIIVEVNSNKYREFNINVGNPHAVVVIVYPQLVIDAGKTVNLCQYMEIEAGGDPTASGGAAPYNYLWKNEGGDTVTYKSNPCVISSETSLAKPFAHISSTR